MEWLLQRFADAAPGTKAFSGPDGDRTYGEIHCKTSRLIAELTARNVRSGQVVFVLADYAPDVFCMLLALASLRCIVVPLTGSAVIGEADALNICGCDHVVSFSENAENWALSTRGVKVANALLDEFRGAGRAGLILFSSGSTGKPKGILHDFERVAEKFRSTRQACVAIPFLMLDHFGGINTLLAITASLGTVVTVATRSVSAICEAIQAHGVDLLPTTPSFLTLLAASDLLQHYDLGSLRRISYGTEVMPQTTLNRIRQKLPGVELQQTYGLSEVGVLRSQSRPDGSLWVRIGGPGFETKVIDGILWVRSEYRMIGYLNAPSGFDEEGWFNTQDRVEVDGDHFRILGRTTDIINVGGQKVYPAEVEDVILAQPNICDVAVAGEPHPLLGQIVVARVKLEAPETLEALRARLRKACLAQLAPFMAPMKVELLSKEPYSVRFKKQRN